MKQKAKKAGFVIKSFLLIFTLFLIAFFLVFIALETTEIEKTLSELKLEEEMFVKIQADIFANILNNSISDLKYLAENFKSTEAEIEREWRTILKSRGIYNWISFIDFSGNELLKLDYANLQAVESGENVSGDEYFIQASSLEEGQIYISKITLGPEEIYPQEVSILICTPVYTTDFSGILVLAYNTNNMLEEIMENSSQTNGEIYFISNYGYWISGQNQYKEVDVEYYDIVYNVGILPEEKWDTLKETGYNIADEGLFTFEEIDFTQEIDVIKQSDDGQAVINDLDCKMVTVIKPGSGYDYYIYSNLNYKLGKILNERYPYIIICLTISVMIVIFLIRNKMHLEKMKDSSNFDPLTNTYNRRQGFQLLEECVSEIKYYKKICLCFIDINGLKEINDNLGHSCGDELIVTVADTIRNTIREQDLIIRMGGDEFLIVITKVGKAIAETIWSRISASFKSINSMEDRKYIISASHGIVEINECCDKNNINALITKADDKMYAEKLRMKRNFTAIRKKF